MFLAAVTEEMVEDAHRLNLAVEIDEPQQQQHQSQTQTAMQPSSSSSDSREDDVKSRPYSATPTAVGGVGHRRRHSVATVQSSQPQSSPVSMTAFAHYNAAQPHHRTRGGSLTDAALTINVNAPSLGSQSPPVPSSPVTLTPNSAAAVAAASAAIALAPRRESIYDKLSKPRQRRDLAPPPSAVIRVPGRSLSVSSPVTTSNTAAATVQNTSAAIAARSRLPPLPRIQSTESPQPSPGVARRSVPI